MHTIVVVGNSLEVLGPVFKRYVVLVVHQSTLLAMIRLGRYAGLSCARNGSTPPC